MPLLKNDALVEDAWVRVADDEALPAAGQIVVSLKRWRLDRERLILRDGLVGVRLTAEQTPGELGEDLEFLGLVEMEFPAFTDGRPYSNARRLRERYGFGGELRAVGDVLRDQYPLMRRCGFDAFEVAAGERVDNWTRAAAAITTPMQPAADAAPPAISLRERRLKQAG
ncbi:MAG: DUF934 domain-containing protein [Rhodospirillaceae bacterium]|jgi:uncharacterized protein (DUF934 family)